MRVQPAPAEHYPWIAQRAGLSIGPDFRAIEAVDGAEIVGMVGYDGWTPNSCCVHIALDKPIAARALLRPTFETPRRLKRDVVLAAVLSTNARSLSLVRTAGFRPLAVIRDGWAKGVDMHLFEMRLETCRWLEG